MYSWDNRTAALLFLSYLLLQTRTSKGTTALPQPTLGIISPLGASPRRTAAIKGRFLLGSSFQHKPQGPQPRPRAAAPPRPKALSSGGSPGQEPRTALLAERAPPGIVVGRERRRGTAAPAGTGSPAVSRGYRPPPTPPAPPPTPPVSQKYRTPLPEPLPSTTPQRKRREPSAVSVSVSVSSPPGTGPAAAPGGSKGAPGTPAGLGLPWGSSSAACPSFCTILPPAARTPARWAGPSRANPSPCWPLSATPLSPPLWAAAASCLRGPAPARGTGPNRSAPLCPQPPRSETRKGTAAGAGELLPPRETNDTGRRGLTASPRRAAGTAPLEREQGTEKRELPQGTGGRSGGETGMAHARNARAAHCACSGGQRGEGRGRGCSKRLRGEPVRAHGACARGGGEGERRQRDSTQVREEGRRMRCRLCVGKRRRGEGNEVFTSVLRMRLRGRR